ncbi:hypothetical protein GLAREA_01686 [Glarea lozoyensis ATCC 20868]|uniref:Uncharacterized protein n=1 Tax=Glarea lozoyensis (strain ATCC 20868 / MF5171) TaxID=1116229 RepID=S3CKR1_GLAL2|nr:uncharacterized protein GLAREA_01686 [Glarea lozoyensis ATCC 20868]EPE25774.1 hypothetical protein GLAREA_01686 [Glarea lozoyensis ATCC 20868]
METDGKNFPWHWDTKPKPLHLRKKSSTQVERPEQQAGRSHEGETHALNFQPRTSSSSRNTHSGSSHDKMDVRKGRQAAVTSGNNSLSARSECATTHMSSSSTRDALSIDTTHSTVSDIKGEYLSDSSSAITGDFVDVNKRRADLFAARMGGQGLFNSPAHAVKITRHDNRYEFEPDTPDILQVEEHSHTSVLTTRRESPVQAVKITRRGNRYEFEPETPEILDVEEWAQMSELATKRESPPLFFPTPRIGHIKNARSAGNARDMGELLRPLVYQPQGSHPARLQRSGSSPQIGCMRSTGWESMDQSPNLPNFVDEYGSRGASARQLRGMSESVGPQRGRQNVECSSHDCSERSGHNCRETYSSSSTQSHQSSNVLSRGHSHDLGSTNSHKERYIYQSPNNSVNYAYEHDTYARGRTADCHVRFPLETPSPHANPPKRSRSPVKRFFASDTPSPWRKELWGKQGLFGEEMRVPGERESEATDWQKSTRSRTNTSSSDQQKKSGMINMLKNKIGGFKEKVDLTPKSSNRRRNENPVETTQLKISLLPKDQAVIYMELEFYLHQTANAFLLAQLKGARISPEAWNKVINKWRGTHPTVKEFMYDQATQQEFIASNQRAFRFHGEHASDEVKVNAVLSSWAAIAKQMTFHTYCDGDFILWKLIHDVKQILEVLGAVDSVMLNIENLESKFPRMKNEVQQEAYLSQPSNDSAFSITPEYMVQPDR